MIQEQLVDYHCHLDLYPQHEAAFTQCRKSDIEVFTVTTTPRAWLANVELAKGAANIRVGLGLHPQLVGTVEADIELFESLAPKARFIGEVGLDAGPRFYKNMELQKLLFARVLEVAARTGPKIISVHSVRSAGIILAMIESHLKGSGCQVVFHWFSGSATEARKAVGLGCWFSINAQMRHSKTAQSVMSVIPLNRMLTETDGPFTEAAPGVANTPANAKHAIDLIAEMKDLDSETVRVAILENLRTIEQTIK